MLLFLIMSGGQLLLAARGRFGARRGRCAEDSDTLPGIQLIFTGLKGRWQCPRFTDGAETQRDEVIPQSLTVHSKGQV
jgi:hypothetical protein